MQVVVTFRNIDATDALRDHAVARLQKVRKFMRRPIEAHVVLAVSKHRHIAEVTLTADRTTYNATEETGDLYSAIDLAMSKVERQIKRKASKLQSRKHDAAVAAPAKAPRARRPRVKRESMVPKPMSVQDAVAELDGGAAEFVVFLNEDSDALSILYRRKGGAYAVLEPEVGGE